jgi:hypothetical protein
LDPTQHHSTDTDDNKKEKATPELMTWLIDLRSGAELQRSRYEYRAARNMRLVKGLPVEDQSIVSNVRKRRKLYFRRIWSAGYRIMASMYRAFLQDLNQFRLEGRDDDEDPRKAKVLQKVVEYYRDRLMRRSSLFVQFMWNFFDIIFLGNTFGKMWWTYNEETGADHLSYKAYPPEQVGCDWTATIPSEMRFYYFDNYLTKDQIEEDYEGIAKSDVNDLMPCSVSISPLRAVRYFKGSDPLMNPQDNPDTSYPESGSGAQPPQQEVSKLYRVTEFFYKKKGKRYFCVVNPEGKVYLKEPAVSPYGDVDTLITGQMLLESHKAWPEGIPEPGEGPQESLNYNLNVRKDNVDMALRVRPVYDRDANVDIAALLDHKTGLPIGVDGDVNAALKFDRPPDVTQSSYVEGNQDMAMLDDYYGTTPTKVGNTNVDKTGVAQINQFEGDAKHDLFIATVGETFFRQWYYTAAQMCAKFCTDEKVLRIANEALRKEDPEHKGTIYDLEDLDLDVVVLVGAGTVSRQARLQQYSAFINQAIQSNNVMALMIKNGIQVPDATLLNVTKIMIDMAPELGFKNIKDYEIPLGGPAPEQGAPADTANQQAAGATAQQPNSQDAGLQDVMQRVFSRGIVNSSFPKGQ